MMTSEDRIREAKRRYDAKRPTTTIRLPSTEAKELIASEAERLGYRNPGELMRVAISGFLTNSTGRSVDLSMGNGNTTE